MREDSPLEGAAGRRAARQSRTPGIDGKATPGNLAPPRRSGRTTSTPSSQPAAAKKKARKSPSAKQTPDHDTSPNLKPVTAGRKGKRSRFGAEAEASAARSLRRRGHRGNFKESSDAEDSDEETRLTLHHKPVSSSEPSSDVDDTVYEPPAEAALPTAIELVHTFGTSSRTVIVPTAVMADLLAAYTILRAFSWQLRLSPFPFEDFVAAMASSVGTSLMDEVHVCVLRALAVDEIAAERDERKLDLSMLDVMSWPCYVWEMLRLTYDPLAAHQWGQRMKAKEQAETSDTAACKPLLQSAPAPSNGAVHAPPSSAGDVCDDAKQDGPVAAMDVDDVQHNPALSMPSITAERPSQAKANLASTAKRTSPRRAFMPLDEAVMDAALSSSEGAARNAEVVFADKDPTPPAGCPEYYSMPIEVKSRILARLCDHLLDCTTIRAEIDRRESAGEFVTGKGGEGGAFAVMTPEEKKKAEVRAAQQQQSDANTDACVLCGLGGNLLCCDGCPAAYHMRCLGESGKSLGEGDWFCPECAVGGRGELAGLRLPVAARDKWQRPLYLLNGTVVRMAVPAMKSHGRHAEELGDAISLVVYSGKQAEEALENACRVRGPASVDIPLGSSFDAVASPPSWPVDPTTGASAGPEGYANRYKNAWAAAVQVLRNTIDDAKRRKNKGGIWIPTGTCGRVVVEELPVPMPLSRYNWVHPQGRPPGRTTVRCGQCHTCLRPTLRKGCLNPTVRFTGAFGSAFGEEVPPETTKLSFLVAFVSKVERDFWALAEGPWATEAGGGMQFRARWGVAVRGATSTTELRNMLLDLESALRPIAFTPAWHGKRSGTAVGVPPSGTAAGGKTRAESRSLSRNTSQAELRSAGASIDVNERVANDPSSQAGDGGVGQDDANEIVDPYSIRSERPVFGGWEVDRRHHSHRVAGVNRLPSNLLRKAARQAGRRPIPGIRYYRGKWSLTAPRLAWVAEAEAAQTIAQLAIVARKLDAALQWDAVVKPRGHLDEKLIRGKRLAADESGYEYLVEALRPGAVMGGAGGGDPGQTLAAVMTQQQQQQFAAIMQQRLIMAHALQQQYLMQQQQQQPQQQELHAAQGNGNGSGFAVATSGPSAGQPAMAPALVHPVPRPTATPFAPLQMPMIFPFMPAMPSLVASSLPQPDVLAEAATIAQAIAVAAVKSENVAAASKPVVSEVVAVSNGTTSGAAGMEPVNTPVIDHEDVKLIKNIVSQAIQKALDNELMDMPAAMAAKFRASRQSLQSGGGGDSSQDLQAGAGESSQPRQQHQQAALPQGVPPMPMALMLPQIACPQQSWIHERDLPLWFICQYEELTRREAANVAARELQAAARAGSLLQQSSAAQEAARNAARAAAQAAADACGICSVAQGDDPDLDELWICCDACNRWFHGECVAMTQADVDAIPQDEKWSCPGCVNALRKMERAARREGVGAGTGNNTAGGPGSMTGASSQNFGLQRGGRPPKPFYERAEYKAGEAKAIEQLRRHSVPGFGRNKKAKLSEEEQAAREAARAERLRRKREEAERAAAEFRPPVHCPVCQYPDYGRPLVDCSACNRQFHYECVGTAVEVVQVALANKEAVRCAECQGKRVRPPSQMLIEAAILAASSGKRSSRGEALDEGLLQKKARTLSPGSSLAAPDNSSPPAWQEAAARVLARTCRLASAEDFNVPVTTDVAPDYLDLVAHPMDLGTLRSRLASGALSSPLDVVAGVRLIVENCTLYNGPDSEYTEAARSMQRSFARMWTQEGLPSNREQWEKLQVTGFAKTEREPKRERASSPPSVSAAAAARVAVRALEPPPGAFPAPDWQARAARALEALCQLEQADAFLEPVPRGFGYYYNVIKRPMDLGTIRQRLHGGEYRNPSQMAADVAQVWANCLAFNEPDAQVVKDAAVAEATFIQAWTQVGVYIGRDGNPAGAASKAGSGAATTTGASAGRSAANWNDAAAKVMYRMHNFVRQASWFTRPVTDEEAPEYSKIIDRPMDLGTVSHKLHEDTYATPLQLLEDVELIWANARQYNGPQHEVTRAANAAAAAFKKIWNNAGLPGLEDEAPTRAPRAMAPPAAAAAAASASAAAAAPQPMRQPPHSHPHGPVPSPHGFGPPPFSRGGGAFAPIQSGPAPTPMAPVDSDTRGLVPAPQQHAIGNRGSAFAPLSAGQRPLGPGTHYLGGRGFAPTVPQHAFPPPAAATAAVVPPSLPPQPSSHTGYAAAAAAAPFGGRSDVDEGSWIPGASAVIDALLHHPCSAPFSNPITDVAAPGYSSVVRQPMDLGTVRWRLNKAKYVSPVALLTDIALVFANCRAYYQPGSEVRAMGEQMEAAFIQQWRARGLPGL